MSESPSSRHDDADSLSAYQAFDFDLTDYDRNEFRRTPTPVTDDGATDSFQATELASARESAGVTRHEPKGASSPRFDPHQTWRAVIDELELSMAPGMFGSYVRDTWVIAYEDGEFIIGLPNAYAYDWVTHRLNNTIKRKLRSHMGRASVQIIFRVEAPRIAHGNDELASTPLFQAVQHTGQPVEAGPVRTAPTPRGAADRGQNGPAGRINSHTYNGGDASAPVALRSRYASQLKAEYTFDTFVVGDHNRLAHAAGTAIVQQPGARYNPFFIYGGVGLGKTHLLHAIGNRVQARGDVVLYCSSEQFTNELIGAIANRTTNEFREKYRQVDVLLIDDIQFLGGKERTQEEFFHTFNHLHASGGQVVLTSDRQPKELGDLEERLRSRFEGGLQVDIQTPDLETRVAILHQKAQRLHIDIEPEALMFVAQRVKSNIRELEGALNHLHLQSQMLDSPLSYSLAMQLMDNLAPQRKPCHPAGVVRLVALHYHVTADELISSVRSQPIAHARQVAMYLLRTENALSFAQIGRELGGRDHSTVRHGVNKITHDTNETNAQSDTLRADIATLREQIYLPYLG